MTIEEGIATYLAAHAGLSALVGDRIYMPPMPQGATLPAVTFFKVTGERQHAMVADLGLSNPLFQFDVWGKESSGKLAIINIAEQLRAALQDYSGTMGTVTVQRCFLEDEADLPFDPEVRLHHRHIDFVIWYRE